MQAMLAEIDSFASAKETDSIKSAIQSEHQQKMAAETARREEVYICWYCFITQSSYDLKSIYAVLLYICWYCCLPVYI